MDADHLDMAAAVPADSLVAQAARKALPAHQYMDAATTAWIASHRGELPALPEADLPRLRPVARRVVNTAPLPPSWHAVPALAGSIHGTRHLLRTATLAAVLAELHGLDDQDTATLVVTAAVHDCRRMHDKDDTGHGQRAAAWLSAHAIEVFTRFGFEPTPERVRQAAVAVRLHERPYAAFSAQDTLDHASAAQLSDLLKTADALDRYRLPKRKWWPDDQHLRVPAPAWLKRVAFELVVDSESACLRGIDSTVAVLTALPRWGLW